MPNAFVVETATMTIDVNDVRRSIDDRIDGHKAKEAQAADNSDVVAQQTAQYSLRMLRALLIGSRWTDSEDPSQPGSLYRPTEQKE